MGASCPGIGFDPQLRIFKVELKLFQLACGTQVSRKETKFGPRRAHTDKTSQQFRDDNIMKTEPPSLFNPQQLLAFDHTLLQIGVFLNTSCRTSVVLEEGVKLGPGDLGMGHKRGVLLPSPLTRVSFRGHSSTAQVLCWEEGQQQKKIGPPKSWVSFWPFTGRATCTKARPKFVSGSARDSNFGCEAPVGPACEPSLQA